MTRVLFVIPGLGTGGAERSLAISLQGYIDHGIEPHVACFHRRDEGVHHQVVEAGTPVAVIDAVSVVQRARAIRALARRIGADVVHTTLFEAHLPGRLAGMGQPWETVSALVNTSYTEARRRDPGIKPWKLEAVRRIDSITARHLTSRFRALTHAVADSEVKALGIDPRRVTVIPRGRDMEYFHPPTTTDRHSARKQLGVEQVDLVVAAIGRQEFQKGIDLAIAAVQASSNRRRIRLLIAGREGNATPAIKQRLREDPIDVVFLGHLPDVRPLLHAADAQLFLSRYEGLGGTLIEGLATGLPTVATGVPAIRELVHDSSNVRLVKDGDIDGAASALDLLLAQGWKERRPSIPPHKYNLRPVIAAEACWISSRANEATSAQTAV